MKPVLCSYPPPILKSRLGGGGDIEKEQQGSGLGQGWPPVSLHPHFQTEGNNPYSSYFMEFLSHLTGLRTFS